jgi:hypothetical protein
MARNRWGAALALALAFAVGGLAGCGDDDCKDCSSDAGNDAGADASDTDTGGDAGADGGDTDADAGPKAMLIVAAADWTATGGGIYAIDPSTHEVTDLGVATGTDAVVRCQDGNVFVLDRFFPNPPDVTENRLVHLAGPDLAVRGELALGLYANLQGAAMRGTDIYVTAFGSGMLDLVDTTTEPYSLAKTIDLTSFATGKDDDGNPDPGPVAIVGDRLFVGLGHEKEYKATPYATIAVYDTVGEDLVDMDGSRDGVQGIELAGTHVFDNALVASGGRLLFNAGGNSSWAGGWDDGAIQAVDLASGEDLGPVATEEEIGGNVLSWALVSQDTLWAVVNRPDTGDGASDALVEIDVSDDPPAVTVVHEAAADALWHVAAAPDGGKVFLADHTAGAQTLRVFDSAGRDQIAEIALPAPANSLCFVGGGI